ncbi:MAG: cyclopropane-fatty-acyl-phospholipid synthase family protein [Gammaproteobacteria bacterium]|jgi:cyclopropane-fatty-acyl-phospholipid synthase
MSTIDRSVTRTEAKQGWLDKFARRQMLRHLQRIELGSLVIEDAGENIEVGSRERRTDIAAKIVVHDRSAYRDFVFGGSIGGAEAYMLGKWSSPELVDVVRLFSANIDLLNGMDDRRLIGRRVTEKLAHWLNRNSERQARENISRHYDLSNDFFALFLDPAMMYSAAIFPHADAGLDEAAVHKLDVICNKLELEPSDHLLEIGTGWGGLAIHAAREYGCRVTTTTISKQQYEVARERVREASLEDRIEVLFEDYRNLRGNFDKLVSVEMIEAVGHDYYPRYFSGCASLLKQDGLMLLQAITVPGQRYEYGQKSVDFIQKYIFPGGSLPSHEAILTTVKNHTDMVMVGMHEIGIDYAKTLAAWRRRFLGKLDQVRALGFDDSFIRMWNYYLCYCQGGFDERIIGTAQILFAKPGWRSPQA